MLPMVSKFWPKVCYCVLHVTICNRVQWKNDTSKSSVLQYCGCCGICASLSARVLPLATSKPPGTARPPTGSRTAHSELLNIKKSCTSAVGNSASGLWSEMKQFLLGLR